MNLLPLAILLLPLPAGIDAGSDWPPDLPTAQRTQARETVLPASVTGTRDEDGAWTLLFTFTPGMEANRITLAGSFNHWNRSANPLRPREDGTWTTRLSLPDGTHWYNWPEQGPLYAITCVLGLWDLWVLFSALRASSTVVVPTALVLSVLLCAALHLLFGVIWSVQWITDPNRLGDNDWGATIVMSKAISHWLTLTFGTIFLHAHVTRSTQPARPTRET